MRLFGLIGYPLSHSFSKKYFTEKFEKEGLNDCKYENFSIVHEARAQFFTYCGYTELDFAGAGTIMSDVAIEYKNQTYYGDTILASVAVGEITKVAFDLFYKLEKRSAEGRLIPVALAKTWMVCYNYDQKKVIAIPEEAIKKIKGL